MTEYFKDWHIRRDQGATRWSVSDGRVDVAECVDQLTAVHLVSLHNGWYEMVTEFRRMEERIVTSKIETHIPSD
jgi:hypothetical protein